MHTFSADVFTVISGVIIFAASQLVQKVYIDPAQQLKRTIADITATITIYANTGSKFVMQDRQVQATDAFRKAAGTLRGDASIIPQYKLWRLLAHLPPYQNIQKASSRLIGLSNAVGDGDDIRFSEWLAEVHSLLSGADCSPKVGASPLPVPQNDKNPLLGIPTRHRSASSSQPERTAQQVGTNTDQ